MYSAYQDSRIFFDEKNRSPFPALNFKLRSEPVATGTFYCNNPTIDNGSKCDHVFVGTKTLVSDVYGINSDKQFVNILEKSTRQRGAMDKLMPDSSKT